jgi:outer membrane protein assembly factor BamB
MTTKQRRMWHGSVSVPVAILWFLVFGLGAAAAADALPMFRLNPARTGYVPAGPEPPLALRWKFKSRRGVNEIESFPAVDDGFSSVSVVAGVVYVGGHDGWVYALDRSSGEKKWEFATRGRVNSTPTYHEGFLYVGSMDNFIYALRAEDGNLVWKFESGLKMFRHVSYGGVRASTVHREGVVYIGG